MAKRNGKKRSTKQRLQVLEQRLVTLEREQHDLTKSLKKLSRQSAARPDPEKLFAKMRRGLRPPPSPRGGPPWRKSFGPVVSLEIPLETSDPAAPLWATVAARLPEEITVVGDDGLLTTYRYSAAGSTPQAPRYRRRNDNPEPFPA